MRIKPFSYSEHLPGVHVCARGCVYVGVCVGVGVGVCVSVRVWVGGCCVTMKRKCQTSGKHGKLYQRYFQ